MTCYTIGTLKKMYLQNQNETEIWAGGIFLKSNRCVHEFFSSIKFINDIDSESEHISILIYIDFLPNLGSPKSNFNYRKF